MAAVALAEPEQFGEWAAVLHLALRLKGELWPVAEEVNALQEYDSFVKKHPEVLDSIKVPAEDIRAKARVLALLSLASQHNELSFTAVKVTLQQAVL